MKKALVLAAAISAGCSDPKTYEDCILRHLKSDATKAATRHIVHACMEKFPPPAEKDKGINLSGLNQWERDAGIKSSRADRQ